MYNSVEEGKFFQGMNKCRAYTIEALGGVIFCDNKRMIDCVAAMNNNMQNISKMMIIY